MISEEQFESLIEDELISLGWNKMESQIFLRQDYTNVINFNLLKSTIMQINKINNEKATLVIKEIQKTLGVWTEMNIMGHKYLNNGVKIYDNEEERFITIKLISNDANQNTFHYIRQFEITNNHGNKRIPDIVLFINGLPICVMELKSPLASEELNDAFDQNQTLKHFSPELWYFNVINFVSNHIATKYGSTTAGIKHFYGWKTWHLEDKQTPIAFLFNRTNIIDIIFNFSFYSDENNPVKFLAAPHQIQAVNNAIETLQTTSDNRGGIIWHTQGSGKSITMVFLTKAIIKTFTKSTILLVTDRKELDQQLYQRFLNAKSFLRNEAINITSRKDLIDELNNKKHFGIYFSTVQKFVEETGALSNRDDIFMLVDEAHRSQNNIFGEKLLSPEQEEIILKFGYAKYMREAFPNAKITGFTGTPLMGNERDSRNIFGDYIHTYSMNQSVQDGATVPIYYEMWNPSIELDKKYLDELDRIQDEYRQSLDPQDLASQQKMETLLKNINKSILFEDPKFIGLKTQEMIHHLQKRQKLLHGKAMIVANSRFAAYQYYRNIIENFPEYQDKTILVMTESNKDTDEKMKQAIVKRNDLNKVASEFRKANSKYKIAIVVDMWLTGFDVPDLDVMYLDKIIKWHNLMQAIARVNRTYEDKAHNLVKESGLIVDFIGIWKYISDALIQYASGTTQKIDLEIDDLNKAIDKLHECFEIINDHYVHQICTFADLNGKEQYRFVFNAYESLLDNQRFSIEEKNKFIKLARKTKRFYKIAYSHITDKDTMICKGIEIINSLLSRSAILNDDHLNKTIIDVKEMIQTIIKSSDVNFELTASKITKDINQVATILITEANNLVKSNPRVATELLIQAIKAQISEISKIKPFFGKKASEKLKEIIIDLEDHDDVDKVIDLLINFSKDITSEQAKPLEFEDPELQIFFDILSNDQFLKYHKSSEVLRAIAIDLKNTVEELNNDNFLIDERIRSKITTKLKKLLKNTYQYPPKGLTVISDNLLKEITDNIKQNKHAFRKDD